jgi:acetyl-CoA carboxylase biotin carboxyl carrier protein
MEAQPVYLTSDDVRDILSLLDTLPYGELHLRTDSFQLSVRRGADGHWTQTTQLLSLPRIVPPATTAATGATASPGPAATPAVTPPAAVPAAHPDGRTSDGLTPDGLTDVRAPLPGTFYRAPRPGSPPFVEVGSDVSEDTVVGIIETMKLMNPVHAGLRGTVAQVCVADAEFAGAGTVLIRITPGPA